MEEREGGCACGAVRYRVRGKPTRVGICHCTDCRQETGSVFMAFAVYPSGQFEWGKPDSSAIGISVPAAAPASSVTKMAGSKWR